MKRIDKIIALNKTSSPISIGDMPLLPSINTQNGIDLLRYYSREDIEKSSMLYQLINNNTINLKIVFEDKSEIEESGDNALDILNIPSVYDIGNNGSTIFVDATYGNDTTAKREKEGKPFKTLTAAKNAAISGDLIVVKNGTYEENLVLKNGVNWYFYPGTKITHSQEDSSAISDNGETVECFIRGYLDIESTKGVSEIVTQDGICLDGANTNINIECNSISTSGASVWLNKTISPNINPVTLNLVVRNDIVSTGYDALIGQTMNVKCKNIYSFESILENVNNDTEGRVEFERGICTGNDGAFEGVHGGILKCDELKNKDGSYIEIADLSVLEATVPGGEAIFTIKGCHFGKVSVVLGTQLQSGTTDYVELIDCITESENEGYVKLVRCIENGTFVDYDVRNTV